MPNFLLKDIEFIFVEACFMSFNSLKKLNFEPILQLLDWDMPLSLCMSLPTMW